VVPHLGVRLVATGYCKIHLVPVKELQKLTGYILEASLFRRLTELSKKINAPATEKGEAGEEEAGEIETRLKRATRRKPKRAA